MSKKIHNKIAISFLFVFIVALAAIKIFLGTGQLYPSVKTDPILDTSKLTTLVEVPFPPGNITVSVSKRIFFNYHPFAKAGRFSEATLFELIEGKPAPFPNQDSQKKFQGVFGLKADTQNRLWLIEPAGLDFPNTVLSAIDLNTNQFVYRFEFPKGEARFAQDLRITADGKKVIIADTGFLKITNPGLIVFDVEQKSYRTLLTSSPATNPQNWIIKGPLGEHHLLFGLIGFFVGIDGIEMSNDQKWLIFAGMTHDSMYRVPLDLLLNKDASDQSVAAAVELISHKPLSDGITQLPDDRIIVTDIENGGLAIYEPTSKRLSTLVYSEKIIWADGVANAPDNSLLFTDSSIPSYTTPLASPPSLAILEKYRPYRIYRLDL